MSCLLNCCNCFNSIKVVPIYLNAAPLANQAAVAALQGLPASTPAATMNAVLRQNGPVPYIQQISAPMSVEGLVFRFLSEQKHKQSPEQQRATLNLILDPTSTETAKTIATVMVRSDENSLA